jgi:hypothetical protein
MFTLVAKYVALPAKATIPTEIKEQLLYQQGRSYQNNSDLI